MNSIVVQWKLECIEVFYVVPEAITRITVHHLNFISHNLHLYIGIIKKSVWNKQERTIEKKRIKKKEEEAEQVV